jgi:hypothetical protein
MSLAAARQGRNGQGALRALSPGSFDDAPENWRILEYELGWQSCPKSVSFFSSIQKGWNNSNEDIYI